MTWEPAANYRLVISAAPTGLPLPAIPAVVNYDTMTPETATSTHYFWTIGRSFDLDDEALDSELHRMVEIAFDQDRAVIEAQQNRLPAGDIRGMRLSASREDVAAMRARSIVDRLVAASGSAR
jgi:vanillate O-demethylase monooxygenase subunit